MGCTIITQAIGANARTERHINANLADAKAYAEACRTPLVKVSVRTDRGTLHRLVPRQRNTGLGQWRWERDG